MNYKSDNDGTTALRTLINKKRQLGQRIEPLVLARLGARYCRQNKGSINSDEASYAVFKRYLEIMPYDEQVKAAQIQVAPLRNTRQRILRWWSIRLIIVGSSLTTFAAIAGIFQHYTVTADQPVQTLSAMPGIQPSTIKMSTAASPVVAKIEETLIDTRPIVARSIDNTSIDNTPITIRAVGDIVLGNNYPAIRLPDKNEMTRITALRQTLGNADIVLGNLEGVLLNQGESRKNIKLPNVYSFRMPESYAVILKNMGFDVLSLANNHALDFGQKGLKSTIDTLNQQNIKSIGAQSNHVAVIKVRNTTVAFLGYSYIPGLNFLDNKKQIREDIQKALKSADLVIVSVHAGKEGIIAAGTPSGDEYFLGEYRGNITEFSEFVIDAGASAVLGHGPHIVRPYKL